MRELVLTAFADTCCGFSPDRVIADPELNLRFLERCRQLGAAVAPVDINLLLLNARKQGLLAGRPRSTRTSFEDEAAYRFASEIAARHIEKRESTTLDRIICDPSVATQFDRLAAEIAPGYLPLQYRWAALNLRKKRSLRPELLSQVVRPTSVVVKQIGSLLESDVPMQQGLYLFYSPVETLYVGEAACLRKRIAKHLDHSDNKNLARWFWDNGFTDVLVEFQTLPDETSTKVRKALEAELIATRHPLFNVQRREVQHSLL